MTRSDAHRFKLFVSLFCLVMSLVPPISAQSVWDKIKQQAKQAQQQGQQPSQQPTQPQKPGQQRQPQRAAKGSPQAAQAEDTGPFTPPSGTKIDPVVMAPIEQGGQYAISPHGIHIATLSHSGSRQVIIYDGVVGPKFDQFTPEAGPVGAVFSPDGNHYAYCGLSSDHFTVMVDGKEVGSGTETNSGTLNCTVFFSPNSKHFYYIGTKHEGDPRQGLSYSRFVIDGKTELKVFEGSADPRNLIFSPDGDHFAAIFASPTNAERTALFIDGKPAPYAAGEPQWSADSKHLFTKRHTPSAASKQGWVTDVLLDGKPIIRADYVALYIPPVGDMTVAVVRRDGMPTVESLVVGGKLVPGSQNPVSAGISNIQFSPDGKHYSAVYRDASNRYWVFSDGKRGETYGDIGSLGTYSTDVTANYGNTVFTSDSSTLVYLAGNGGKEYVVYGGQESDEVRPLTDCLLSTAKNHFLTTGSGYVTLDGKVLHLPHLVPNATQASALGFSPDGSHFAFVAQAREGPSLFLDGIEQTAYRPGGGGPMTNISTRPYIFSPDSKHIAYFCRSADPAVGVDDLYLCVDDKAVRLGRVGGLNLTFTPDSNHLVWTRDMGMSKFRVYVDGKPVVEGFLPAVSGFRKDTWQLGPDNNVLLLMQDDTSLKRVSITPSPETSLSTLLGSSPALPSKP